MTVPSYFCRIYSIYSLLDSGKFRVGLCATNYSLAFYLYYCKEEVDIDSLSFSVHKIECRQLEQCLGQHIINNRVEATLELRLCRKETMLYVKQYRKVITRVNIFLLAYISLIHFILQCNTIRYPKL